MKVIMPKGDGQLSTLNAALKVYYNYRNKDFLDNEEFKKMISREMNFPIDHKSGNVIKDGPFLIKKSEIARYFGLISYDFKKRRGKISKTGILFFEAKNDNEKIKIIFDSLRNLSFGKNNSAIESGDSIIDPPKLFLKSIYELNYITKEDFALILYRTADENKTFRESIIEINETREKMLKPTKIPAHLKNKYFDIKFVVFFENFNIVKKNKSKYFLSKYIYDNYLTNISELSIYNNKNLIDTKYLIDEENINEKLDYKIVNKEILERINNRIPELDPKARDNTRYKTNRRISETVLRNADYKCFLDSKHLTFSRINETQYMEAHHIIPMKAQSDFIINIDREENILSLCPTCHRKVHFAKENEKKDLLEYVYKEKKVYLSKANINISFEDLYEKYYWNKSSLDLSYIKNLKQLKASQVIKNAIEKIIKEDKINLTEEEIVNLSEALFKKYLN